MADEARSFAFERRWVKSGAALAPTGCLVDLLAEVDRLRTFSPRRDDAVATWLKRLRDAYTWDRPTWSVLDDVLDDYRLHADTGTPLDRHVREGSGDSS